MHATDKVQAQKLETNTVSLPLLRVYARIMYN